MKKDVTKIIMFIGLMAVMACETKKMDQAVTTGPDGFDRTVLPIKEPIPPTSSELDVRNAHYPLNLK
jgi:hypothetical protein